jgi:hypothetical protein
MIDKYTEDIAVDGSLIQKELGFVPHYDLKTGWEEAIKEMRYSGVRHSFTGKIGADTYLFFA